MSLGHRQVREGCGRSAGAGVQEQPLPPVAPLYVDFAAPKEAAKQATIHDAVIVLGCRSATGTARRAVPAAVKVIEGIKATGIMNGRIRLSWSGDLFFDNCEAVPMSQQESV